MELENVAQVLFQSGTIGVIPTDTVYGVVARAVDHKAVARLYALKRRDHKPGTLIAADLQQLVELGIKYRYLKAVEQFWPAPLSVIIPCGPELTYLHQGLQSLAVRIPNKEAILELLKVTGPLLTSSANQPGEMPAATIEKARAYFHDNVDFYCDGGDLSRQQPSSLIRIVDDAIEVIREGAVPIKDIEGKAR